MQINRSGTYLFSQLPSIVTFIAIYANRQRRGVRLFRFISPKRVVTKRQSFTAIRKQITLIRYSA